MKTGNVVVLNDYQTLEEPETPETSSISEELASAIQALIYRLRELGPL